MIDQSINQSINQSFLFSYMTDRVLHPYKTTRVKSVPSFVHYNPYVFREQTGGPKILNCVWQ